MQVDLSKYQKGSNPMAIVAAVWNHGQEIAKTMEGKGIAWPRFKKGELVDVLEFVRIPRRK